MPTAPGAGDSTVTDDHVRLTWGRSADTAYYEFQLARDAEFSDLVTEERLEAPGFELSDGEAGTYHFRARGVSDEAVKGPWSPVNSFEIEADPWPPTYLIPLLPLILLL